MRRYLAALPFVLTLASCGGGGGGDPSARVPPAPTTLSLEGTVAAGLAIMNAPVGIKCMTGETNTTTDDDGNYKATISGGEAPCVLQVTDPLSKLTLHSLAEKDSTRANINPVTELVTATLFRQAPLEVFARFSQADSERVASASVREATERVRSAVGQLIGTSDFAQIDPLRVKMVAASPAKAGDAFDRKLDVLMTTLTVSGKRLDAIASSLAATTTADEVRETLLREVGQARHSVASCPYVRSGRFWVLSASDLPLALSVDATPDDRGRYLISDARSGMPRYFATEQRNTAGTVIACFFKLVSMDGRISGDMQIAPSGLGGYRLFLSQGRWDAGIVVPSSSQIALSDRALTGDYGALLWISNPPQLTGGAARFNVRADGKVTGFLCDLVKASPDCTTAVIPDDDQAQCKLADFGAIDCTSTDFAATVIPFVQGPRVMAFYVFTRISVAGMPKNSRAIAILSKSVPLRMPAQIGQLSPVFWHFSSTSAGSVTSSPFTTPTSVIALDPTNSRYTTQAVLPQYPQTFTVQLNKPTEGMSLTTNDLTGTKTIRLYPTASVLPGDIQFSLVGQSVNPNTFEDGAVSVNTGLSSPEAVRLP
jgi:hypothetical protein